VEPFIEEGAPSSSSSSSSSAQPTVTLDPELAALVAATFIDAAKIGVSAYHGGTLIRPTSEKDAYNFGLALTKLADRYMPAVVLQQGEIVTALVVFAGIMAPVVMDAQAQVSQRERAKAAAAERATSGEAA
jgi:hypothetical protein